MDPAQQDSEDANYLYSMLENEVIPTFYERSANGLPENWIRLMKNAMRTLPFQFSARRMVTDYAESVYGAAVNKRNA